MRPFSPRTSRQATILIAVSIWVVGLAVALPLCLFSTTITDPTVDDGEGPVGCITVWPDTTEGDGSQLDQG